METPPPVNLSALSGLLAKSKSVMQKVENTKPITLSETTQKLTALEETEEPQSVLSQPRAAGGYTREQVINSKFPEAVKEAMLKSIPPSPPARLEDMSDLEDVKMIPNKRSPILKQPINETRKQSTNSDMITISRSELKELINEGIMEVLTQSYNKNLTEAAIKKTISTLINEGKLNIKKKTI